MIDINKKALAACAMLGKPFDEPTKRLILEFINSYRVKFIKDTIASNKRFPLGVIQTIYKRIDKLDIFDPYYISNEVRCLKTVEPISIPIRNTLDSPFIHISSPSGQITFANSELNLVRVNSKGKFTNNNRYVYDNYLYLYSNDPSLLTFNKVKIVGAFEDPFVVDDEGRVHYDIFNYPLPEDFSNIIIREIITNFFKVPYDDKEVLIDE